MACSLHRKAVNSAVVFFFSMYAACSLLIIERLAGIGLKFHPDSEHYLSVSSIYSSELFNGGNFFSFVNNGYYLLVAFLKHDITSIVALNIVLFSITNVLLFHALSFHKSRCRITNEFYYLFVIVILFDPYRMHLAIHILKDTLVLLLSALFIVSGFFTKVWIFLVGLMFRKFFFVNIIFLFTNKMFYISLMCVGAISIVYLEQVSSFLDVANKLDMNVRTVDSIPNFFSEGVLGAIKRALLWPLLYVSGAFIVFASSPLYLPVAMQVTTIFMFRFFFLRSRLFDLRFLSILFVIALVVSSFTAYVRYALPFLYTFLLVDLSSKNK